VWMNQRQNKRKRKHGSVMASRPATLTAAHRPNRERNGSRDNSNGVSPCPQKYLLLNQQITPHTLLSALILWVHSQWPLVHPLYRHWLKCGRPFYSISTAAHTVRRGDFCCCCYSNSYYGDSVIHNSMTVTALLNATKKALTIAFTPHVYSFYSNCLKFQFS
jgi:hypothetical protein